MIVAVAICVSSRVVVPSARSAAVAGRRVAAGHTSTRLEHPSLLTVAVESIPVMPVMTAAARSVSISIPIRIRTAVALHRTRT